MIIPQSTWVNWVEIASLPTGVASSTFPHGALNRLQRRVITRVAVGSPAAPFGVRRGGPLSLPMWPARARDPAQIGAEPAAAFFLLYPYWTEQGDPAQIKVALATLMPYSFRRLFTNRPSGRPIDLYLQRGAAASVYVGSLCDDAQGVIEWDITDGFQSWADTLCAQVWAYMQRPNRWTMGRLTTHWTEGSLDGLND